VENAVALTQQHSGLAQLSQHVVYLMGLSFVLGSLFTIFILVLLDMSRVRKAR
jgi:hypothetical protein